MEENNKNLTKNIKEKEIENIESQENISQKNPEENLKAQKEKRKNNIKEAIEWIVCTIIALIIVLTLKYYVAVPTVVRQSSMFPTLKDGERLLLNRTHRLDLNEIKKGDIITFEQPKVLFTKETADQNNAKAIYDDSKHSTLYNFFYYVIETPKVSFIKRIIGVAGDHIEIKDNKIFVNGTELKEDYLPENTQTKSEVFTDFIVPEGHIFAVGDNRDHSVDCREFGCIPLDKIEGTVICRFWPLNQISGF